MSRHVYPGSGGMGKGVGHSAAVPDDIKPRVFGLQMFIDLHLHIVEFDFYTIKQSIVVCRARCDLVQSIDHFHDAV